MDLYDKTAGTVLWRGRVKTDPEGGFITNAEFYSSPQGFDLPKDHKIVTRVQYTNPYAHPIDAMATANVYLACDEKRHPKECAY